MVKWRHGAGAMIDVFDDRAVEWFKERLNNLKSVGIDSFKFDGGDACFMPKGRLSVSVVQPTSTSRSCSSEYISFVRYEREPESDCQEICRNRCCLW